MNPGNPQPQPMQQPQQQPRTGMFEQFVGQLFEALQQGFNSDGRGPGM